MDFASKVIVVTGGASGIGQATAREFAARNGAVFIFDRNQQAGRETAEALRGAGHAAEYFPVDLAVSAQVEHAVEQVAARMGGIDILANVAGIQSYGTAVTTPEAEWDETLNANVRSAFLVSLGASSCAIAHMVRLGGGSIVVVGSVQSMTAQRNSMAYVVSKHAGLAKCTHGIIIVSPSFLDKRGRNGNSPASLPARWQAARRGFCRSGTTSTTPLWFSAPLLWPTASPRGQVRALPNW